MFTGALYNQYQAPPGFCFDILCDDEPIIDDRRSSDYNVEMRVRPLLDKTFVDFFLLKFLLIRSSLN